MRTAVVLAALALGSTAALAEEPGSLEIVAGNRVNVCTAGLARCPLMTSACDDPRIAAVELGKAGAELVGVSPGTTLCGLVGAGGLRRVVRVKVVAPPGGARSSSR
jgi:hypothetical protein